MRPSSSKTDGHREATVRIRDVRLGRPGSADVRPRYKATEKRELEHHLPKFHFHYALRLHKHGFRIVTSRRFKFTRLDTPRLARTLDSLVRVSRRVGKRPEDSSLTGVERRAKRRQLPRIATVRRRRPERRPRNSHIRERRTTRVRRTLTRLLDRRRTGCDVRTFTSTAEISDE